MVALCILLQNLYEKRQEHISLTPRLFRCPITSASAATEFLKGLLRVEKQLWDGFMA